MAPLRECVLMHCEGWCKEYEKLINGSKFLKFTNSVNENYAGYHHFSVHK